MASADPDVASLAASIAVNAHLKRLDAAGRKARTRAAREGLLKKYFDIVDPDRVMSDAERLAAAKNARAEEMARISLLGVKARKELAELRQTAQAS